MQIIITISVIQLRVHVPSQDLDFCSLNTLLFEAEWRIYASVN